MHFIDYLESNKLPYQYQFGIQRQPKEMSFFTNSIHWAMGNGQFTGSVSIDLRKAFDAIDH